MIVCQECGHQNVEGDTFCGSCGAFLEWTGEKLQDKGFAGTMAAPVEPAKRAGIVERVKAVVGADDDTVSKNDGEWSVRAETQRLEDERVAEEIRARELAEQQEKVRVAAEQRAQAAAEEATAARRAAEDATRRAADEAAAAKGAAEATAARAARQAEADAQAARAAAETAAAEALRRVEVEAQAARAAAEQAAKVAGERASAEAAAAQKAADDEAQRLVEAEATKRAADAAVAQRAAEAAAAALRASQEQDALGKAEAARVATEAEAAKMRAEFEAMRAEVELKSAQAHADAEAAKAEAAELRRQAEQRGAAGKVAEAEELARVRAGAEAAAAKKRAEAEVEAARRKAEAAAEAAALKAKSDAEIAASQAEDEARRRRREAEEAEARAAQEKRRQDTEAEAAKRAREEALRKASALVAKPVAAAPAVAKPAPAAKPVVAAPIASAPASGAPKGVDPVVPGAAQPTAQQPKEGQRRVAAKKVVSRDINTGDLICGNCGEGNPPARKFCRKCGTTLAEAVIAKISWWRRLVNGLFGRRKRKKLEKIRMKAGERPASMGGRTEDGKLKKLSRRARMVRFKLLSKIAKLFAALAILSVVGMNAGPVRDKFMFPSMRQFFQRNIQGFLNPKFDPLNPQDLIASLSPGAEKAFDSFDNTFWSGNGSAGTISVTFRKPVDIDRIGFLSGGEEFAQPLPRQISVTLATGETVAATPEPPAGGSASPQTAKTTQLQRKATFQHFKIKGRDIKKVTIEVDSVYPGSTSQDVSVREIEFFEKRKYGDKYDPVFPKPAVVADTPSPQGKGAGGVQDEDLTTSWVTGDGKDGVNQKLVFTFREPTDLDRIRVGIGASADKALFFNQPRPKEITVTVTSKDGLEPQTLTFKDNTGFQTSKFEYKGVTKVELIITQVHGEVLNPTATGAGIAEIEFQKKKST